ncbi:WXG100 family type VII secretion target [Rummeliibacillus pycnus]|uniref:WXG100 family type VII secretion target n=1 Tax=Rummeliibacillus pycnus TaxID=101070 RepID=UPI003D2741F3
MAGQIRMTPQELKSKAKKYDTCGEQIITMLGELDGLQGQLRSEWEGKAFQQFDAQFEQLKPKVKNFAELLKAIKEQLDQTADAVEEHDMQLSKNFGLQ